MCHQSVYKYVNRMITPDMVTGKNVLECGSFDVNGSVRPHVEQMHPGAYLGIDLRSGPRVDRVMTADELDDEEFLDAFDLVVSTEMLEHVENWRTAIYGMLVALKPGGHLVLTTRSPGFPLHDYPGDHWRYPRQDMFNILWTAGLDEVSVEDDPLPGHPGVFAHAVMPKGWVMSEASTAAWAAIELPKP